MLRIIIMSVALGALLVATTACSSTGTSTVSDADRRVFVDEKGNYRPEWAAGINRPAYIDARLAQVKAK